MTDLNLSTFNVTKVKYREKYSNKEHYEVVIDVKGKMLFFHQLFYVEEIDEWYVSCSGFKMLTSDELSELLPFMKEEDKKKYVKNYKAMAIYQKSNAPCGFISPSHSDRNVVSYILDFIDEGDENPYNMWPNRENYLFLMEKIFGSNGSDHYGPVTVEIS